MFPFYINLTTTLQVGVVNEAMSTVGLDMGE